MSKVDSHLTDALIFGWLRDEVSAETAKQIEDHLATCDRCAKRIDELETDDVPVIEALKRMGSRNRSTTVQPSGTIAADEEPGHDRESSEQTKRFSLKDIVSVGGSGQVWLARDTQLGREVAVKELRPERASREAYRKRFRREAMITARLSHPGVVPLYDYVEGDGEAFYTMQFIQGRTLRELARKLHRESSRSDPYPIAEQLKLLQHVVSVCNTIAYAHSKRILHRDLKGDNVIVGQYGEVRVVDWGIAKHLAEDDVVQDLAGSTNPSRSPSTVVESELRSHTMEGSQLGTPGYMSPEQVVGAVAEIDERTDVYGLAALTYEVLTGYAPFQARDLDQVLANVRSAPPKPPSELVPGVPQALEAICLQGLSKSKQDRQQSALEFGRAIEDWVASQLQRHRSAEERERLFALSQDLLAIVDADGVIRQVNPACERLFGWTADEMVGRRDVDLVHPDDRADVIANRTHMLASNEPTIGFERKIRCKDGSFRWISLNTTPVPEERTIYIVGRDVTRYRMLEQRLSGLMNCLPDAVLVANRNGIVQMANDEAIRMLGFSRDELVGLHVTALVAERSMDEYREILRELSDDPEGWSGRGYKRYYGKRKDGNEFRVQVRHSVWQSGDELLYMGAIRTYDDEVT
ncbi:MAG: PAS domain S-box protein [Planctomycetota bacterium]